MAKIDMIGGFSYKRLINLILLWSGLWFFTSCERKPEPITREGVISGIVRDEESNELGGVLVTAFGPYGESSVMTDNDGKYEFTGMGNGSYCLEFSRNDMGTRRIYNVRIFKDEKYNGYITLYTLPGSFNLPALTKAYIGSRPRSYPSDDWVCIQTAARSNNREYYNYGFDLILFFSTNDKVSCSNYDYIERNWIGYFWDDPITLYIDPNTLPFKKGEEVFVKAYAANKHEDTATLDPYTGLPEFSTLDRNKYTNTVSFVMP